MAGTGVASRNGVRQAPGSGGWGEARRRLGRAAVALIPGAAALASGLYGLGRPSLWRDEAYTLDAAHRSVPQIFTLLSHTDAVNGAYYLLMHPVIAAFGASAAAMRMPSVLAMSAAAVITAAIGRRLARAGGLPCPGLTGALAGLLLAAAPLATLYAQDARSYAIVTMCATAATYLLLRALAAGQWRWWAGYGAAIAVAGLLHLLALLLVGAHAVTLAIVWARGRRGPAGPGLAGGQVAPVRWLTAVAAAGAALAPLIAVGLAQSRQIGWLTRPGPHAIGSLAIAFAGSGPLLPLAALLAAGGVAAGLANGGRRPLDVAVVALPWLVLPPAVLIAASQAHPVYDARYVVFCLPALALLLAAGLAWLARLTGAATRQWARRPNARTRAGAAWLPSAALLAVFAALAAGPQQAVRAPASRTDNLRKVAQVLAAREQAGDAILYMPANKRVVSMAYPAPFQRLWDVALAKSPVEAGNLIGTQVKAPALLRRVAGALRLWVVTGRGAHILLAPKTRLERAEVAALRLFRLLARWRAGAVSLSLFARG